MGLIVFESRTCVKCGGRVWLTPAEPNGWPLVCACTRLPRVVTQYSLARLLGIGPRVLANVHRGRARPSSCARTLTALDNNRLL